MLQVPTFLELPDSTLIQSQRVTLGIWKGWIVAPLLYFWVLMQSLTNADQIQKLLRVFVYSAVLVSLIAYGYSLFGGGLTDDFRLRGFYESANYLALYLLPAALLNMIWIFNRQGHLKRYHYFDVITLTILLHALLFTQSYGAILGLFGTLLLYGLYLILIHRRQVLRTFLGLLVLLLTLSLMVFSQLNAPKLKQTLDFENRSSTTVRFEVYRVTWELIREKWLFGHGPGLFQAHYQTRAPEVLGRAPMEWNIPHPHNLFFAFWLNAGLLGLLALLGLIWLAHQRFTYPLLAFWGIILHGFFDTPFWKNDLAMIFWLVIGCIALLQSYGTHSPQMPEARTRVQSHRGASKRAHKKPQAA